MDFQKVIDFLDNLIYDKTSQHLSDLQRIVLQKTLSEPRKNYDEIAEDLGYSVSYVKQDVGPKLWKLLSDVCGEKVKKTNLRAALKRQFIQKAKCTKLSDIAQLISGDRSAKKTEILLDLDTIKSAFPEFADSFADTNEIIGNRETDRGHTLPTRVEINYDRHPAIVEDRLWKSKSWQDWGEAPDVSVFYGRDRELALLEQWLVKDRCRLVGLLGMGGIGKTHLSVKLGERLENEFEYIIWRSLTHAPPLQQILTNILQCLNPEEEKDLPTSTEELISHTIDYLKKHRCLLVLDNAETIMCSGTNAGHYKEGCENYGELLKLVGECRHNSCLLLTSREKPKEIALMQGKTLPVRCLRIGGLSIEAANELLQLHGCYCGSDSKCKFLIEQYGGNPLALKIVFATIQELFQGNISEFIKQNTLVFDEINELLDKQFNRLSDLGKTFLYWLAIEQDPISAAELQADIFPKISQKQLIETLKSLAQRSLIDKNSNYFSLQPVVREYLVEKFIEEIISEIETGELVLFNRHAMLKAQGKEYIRNAQVKFIIKPVIERLIGVFKNRKNIEIRLKKIISKLQAQSFREPGYAAGNILNILCQLQIDLKGYDFSHLTVWQAYLQDCNLHNVNFTGADLRNSTFVKQLTNILSIAFSTDGQLLATGDVNGEIRLWQMPDGKLLLNFQGHAGWVNSVSFSPDNRILSSASSDQTVKLWNVSEGKCLKTLEGHNQRVRSVTFSPDGTTLASGSSDRTVRLWDANTGKVLQILSGHASYIWSIKFSPDGTILASGSEDKTVKIWDISAGKCLKTLEGHALWVRSVAFSPDGKTLGSVSGDRTLKLWNISTGECFQTLEGHTQRVRDLAFSPDGSIIVTGGGDHTLRLWDFSTGRCLKTLHGHSSRLSSVAFSPDGTIIASAGEDRAVKLWEVKTGQCLQTWQGYGSWIQSIAFSQDGKILASGSEDGKIRFWELGIGQSLPNKTLQGHDGWVCSVAFSPTGKIFASASSDYSLKLWDLSTGMCLKTLLGHTRWVRSVVFSPDGKKLASGGGDCTVKLWDIPTRKCLKTLSGHTGWIWSVAFSPNGLSLASSGEDKTVRLWNIRTDECLKTLSGHHSWVQCVVFSPDGQIIASGSCDGTIKLWDVSTGECLKTLWGHHSWVQSVAFSPDGQTIASGSCDGTIKLWNVNDGKCWQTLRGHTHWVWSVAFSSDGKTIASGSQDETIRLWDAQAGQSYMTLTSKRPLEKTCITGARGLTKAQLITLKALGAVY